MEISIPTWNAATKCYTFTILQTNTSVEEVLFFEPSTKELNIPATSPSVIVEIVREFIEKSKKYFTNPLSTEKVLRHLRQTTRTGTLPIEPGWYSFCWKPTLFLVKVGEYELAWSVSSFTQTTPVIPAEFTASKTPRAQSPLAEVPEQTRNIQIHDTLIPVGDLPLSDLPPLSFTTNEVDTSREESKRRVREARLKVALAKLKAQRMEHKYFERYGQAMEDSEDSSDFSTDSEGEVSFEEGAER
jgi:hypothetical protein